MRRALPLLALLPLVLPSPSARAASVGVPGVRLVLQAKADGTDARLTLALGKDAGISKGGGVSRKQPPGLRATLDVFHTDAPATVRGTLTMGADGWVANGTRSARYADAGATGVVRAAVRNGKAAAVEATALGEGGAVFDLQAADPSDAGGLTTVLTVENAADGTLYRMCTRWAVGDGSRLVRRTKRGRTRLTATRGVAVDCPPLVADPACEGLNAVECLLPYPSSRFLEPASTPTGYALRIPQQGIPQPDGPTIPASAFDVLDGFSPGAQVLMHFPQGVDVAASDAPRLQDVGCCGQPAGPPWIDTRTMTGRALDDDSPTVLLDATTGERILHFIENDARATDPARVVTFLRPGVTLVPEHRYVVAVRRLVAPDGAAVEPERVFRLLRDGIVSDDAAVEARRPHFEDVIFPALAAAGVGRSDLVLAFDFVVASEHDLNGMMLSMRDQAYAWLDGVEADSNAVPFTVTSVVENDCDAPGTVVWRTIAGTYDVPLFLESDLDDTTTPRTLLDENGVPKQNGFHHARLFATLPCSLLAPVSIGSPVLMGHGLFQTGDLFPSLLPSVVQQEVPWTGIAVGTDWRGLSGIDLTWVANRVIGTTESQLQEFPALPARLRQGMLNTLVLARLMKRGILNRDPAFRFEGGGGVFPGPAEPVGYFGISLGGIMGTYLAGLTPDIAHFGLDVGAVNFSCMLQRATPFVSFYALLDGIGFTEPMQVALGLGLTHEFWAQAEPVSVVRHVTEDPLPGSGDAKRVFYSAAWLDKQVSNVCTEIAARTMKLPVIAGSIQQGLQGMPDVAGPVPSALAFHSNGELDITNPAHAAYIPPLANLFPSDVCDPHPRHASIRAVIRQMLNFIASGEIVNECDGLCDGATDDERPVLGTCTP